MRKFWNWIRDDAGGRVLRLEGPIDEESFWSDGVTPRQFREELYAEEGDVTVYINSPGGNVFAAAEVYTMIRDYPGNVTVKIDAIAASAASVVAMAGDRVMMSPVAMLMIHDPMTIAMGNTRAMEKAITSLNEVKESLVNAYVAKTGLSRNKVAKLLSDETWLNARKAVELGFADEIMFAGRKTERDDDPDDDHDDDHDNDRDDDDDTPEEERKRDGEIHLDACPMAAALEGVLYSTRAMGQTILNSLGAFVEGESLRTEGEAHSAEDEPEGEAAPVEEDPAPQEEPVKTDREEAVSLSPTDEAGITGEDTSSQDATRVSVEAEEEPKSGVLPGGSIVINMEGRTEDGSMPYIILKNQLDRMR